VGEIWGTPSLDDLVNLGDSTPGPDFAALAPAITNWPRPATRWLSGFCAGGGRPGGFCAAGARQAAPQAWDYGEVPVAWTGGVMEKMTLVREAFFAGLHAAAPEMPVARESRGFAEGALWRASGWRKRRRFGADGKHIQTAGTRKNARA
jgi:glucosamine kinase